MFSADPILSTLFALGTTLGLIWLAAKALTIISRNAALPALGSRKIAFNPAPLSIESITAIAPHRKIIVLRYGEQRLAVLTGGPQDISLGWLPPLPP